MPRRRLPYILLAAFALAVALALGTVWHRGRTSSDRGAIDRGVVEVGADADADSPARAPNEPILRARGRGDAPGERPARDATPHEEPAAETEIPPGHVRIRLHGPADLAAEPVAIRLDAACRPPLDRPIGSWHEAHAETTDLGVERVLALPGLAHLRLTLRHPGCLDESLLVPREALNEAIVIRLRPAVVAVGRLLHEDGTGFETADAALHETGPDAPMHDGAKQWVPTYAGVAMADADGRFRLKVAKPGTYLFVAGEYRHAPVGRLVHLARDETTDLGDVVLSEGARIEGRLTVQDRPASGARLEARPTAEGRAFTSIGGRRFVWDGRRLVARRVQTTTDEGGRFVLAGLAPIAHVVALVDLERPAYDYSGALAPLGEVVASASGVELAVRGFELRTRTRRSEKPAPLTTVVLGAGWAGGRLDAARLETDERGEGVALLRPHTTYEVQALVPTGAHAKVEVTTGEVGSSDSLVLDLGPDEEGGGGRLVVFLRAEDETPVEAARLRCTSESGGITVQMAHPYSPTGRFELELPQPGRWHVVVVPGTAEDSPEATDYLPHELSVDVDEGAEVHRSLVAVPGGRLLIELRDGSGSHVPAGVTVHDERGVRREITWRIQGVSSTFRNARRLDGTGPAVGNEVLLPGTYEVEILPEEGEPIIRRVKVRARETTRIQVTAPAR